MSATLRASPSWLASLGQSPSGKSDARFKTFAAKDSPPRTRAAVGPGLFDGEKGRVRRGSERESLEDELADLEGIGGGPDGAWLITVAEAARSGSAPLKSDARLTVYVSTPTSSLTLTRTYEELLDAHARLSSAFPTPPSASRPSTKAPPSPRKRNVLASLTRTLSPRRNGSFGSLRTPNRASSAQPVATPEVSSLANALSSFSKRATVREHPSWREFFAVRTDDLKSERVERRIKRYRSDQTLEVSRNRMSDPFVADNVELPSSRSARQDDSTATNTSMATDLDSTSIAPVHVSLATGEGSPSASPEVDTHWILGPDGDDLPSLSQVKIASQSDPHTPEAPRKMRPASDTSMLSSTPTTALYTDTAREGQLKSVAESIRRPRSPGLDENLLSPTPQHGTLQPASPSCRSSSAGDAESASRGLLATGMTRSASDYSVGTTNSIDRRSKAITLDSFEMMRVLGKGCAGKVLLVREKKSGRLLALKAITKRHVLAHRELEHTRTEQAVLKACAREELNPFVVKLHYSFHDEETLYLALDFHPGGDLATQLARWGRLGRDRARFFICEIIEGLDGLHRAGIIYRDLKPENVLISAEGHCVLTDFGLSKDFQHATRAARSSATGLPRPHWLQHNARSASTPPGSEWLLGSRETTMSFCGTAEYLAPECLLGEPYSYEVDIWAAGTMLFEMLAGVAPFWASDHATMYKRVLHDELDFHQAPDHFDNDARVLLRGMLQRDPLFRITIPRIKRMPYFQQISWEFIREKRYNPPFVPTLNPLDPTDTSHFEDAFLMMPPQVKGDPHDDPGAGRDPPEGKAQDPIDKDGRDVFDGYSYYGGRDSASIHDDDDDDAENDTFAGFGAYTQDAELDETDPQPSLPTRHSAVSDGSAVYSATGTAEQCLNSCGGQEPTVAVEEDIVEEEPDDEEDVPQLGGLPEMIIGKDGRITSLHPYDGLYAQQWSPRVLHQRSGAVEADPREPERQQAELAKIGVVEPGPPTKVPAPVPEQSAASQGAGAARDPESAAIKGDGADAADDADDADDWVALETGPMTASVRNGGREATLWERGFRDRYRMTLAPIVSPSRPPRRPGKSGQASRAGSVSSAVSSSQVSPASTPELSSSPRPLGLIRRFTSPRQSLNSAALRSHDGSLDSGSPRLGAASHSARLGVKTSKTSLAPSGSSTVDRASSTGGDSRRPSPIHRLAKSASGFIEKF